MDPEFLFKEVNKRLSLVAKTGKIIFGTNNVKWALRNRRVKMVIIASNAPREIEEELRKICELRRVPIFKSDKSSREIGGECLRPHIITSLAIMDFGVLSSMIKGGKSA